MKVKGIPFWEQYLEFIVLGIAVLVFGAFVAMQFVGNPNAIDDQRGGIVIGPNNIDQLLEDEAERLRPNFESNAPSPVDLEKPDPVLPEFEQHLSSAVSPSDTIEWPQVAFAPTAGATVIITDVAFIEPQINSPYTLLTQQYFDALPPEIVEAQQDLQLRMPNPPYDVTWITASATFDVAEALQEFRRTGPDGISAPVPPSWYDGRITILDVVIEREEQVNGGWTDHIVVDTLPGQFSLRPRLRESNLTPADRDDMQEQLTNERTMSEILQPEFYQTRNASWYPPVLQQTEELTPDMTDDERRILQLQNDLVRLRTEFNRLEQLLADAGGELYGDRGGRGGGGPTGGASGDGGGGGRTPGGSGMAGGSQNGRRTPGGAAADKRNNDKRRSLTTKRDKLFADTERVEKQLTDLGAQVAEAEDQGDMDPFSQDTVQIWGHDLDVTPGATYRYRFTVRVLNPYFKREVHLLDNQKHLAESIYIASTQSEWSDPIVAKPPLESFIVNASATVGNERPGKLGLGQTSVEVFRFYDGRWWKDRFAVEPGQRIGELKSIRQTDPAMPSEIDFGTDWYVLDIVEDLNVNQSNNRGRAASVLLQSISYPDVFVWRHPNADISALRRQELEERVRLAELGADAQASAN